MLRRSVIFTLFVVACSDGKDKDVSIDTDLGTTEDTYEPVLDTDDTDRVIDENDTGVSFAWQVEGLVTVAPRAKLDGYQTLTARWMHKGAFSGPPRCIYQQRLLDWEHAHASDLPTPAANPISSTEFNLCEGCAFSFTVTTSPGEVVDRYPWTEAADTDDTDTVPADVVSSGKLNCENLVAHQGATPADQLPTEPMGWAFHPTLDGDNDANTGLWLRWIGRYNTWSAYSYDVIAQRDLDAGTVHWTASSKAYGYY